MTNLTLHIAHLADTHSRIVPHDLKLPGHVGPVPLRGGGYPLLISAIRAKRERASALGLDFMVFHSGDSFQGSAHFREFPGQVNAAMLNLLGLDAMAVGNHEFDMGFDVFADFCSETNFPIIASNLSVEGLTPTARRKLDCGGNVITASDLPSALVRTMADGTPLAVLGLTLEALPELARVGPGIEVTEPIDCARRQVAELRAQGVTRILVLSHLGEEGDRQLARAVPEISAILGGHSHRLYGKSDTFSSGKSRASGARTGPVPIFHCGENGQHFGAYTLRLDASGRAIEAHGETIVPVDATNMTEPTRLRLARTADVVPVVPATDVRDILDRRFPLADRGPSTPLVINKALPHVRVPTEQTRSILAPIFAETILNRLREADILADIALLNAGVIRSGIAAGEYREPHELLSEIIPFDLDIVVVRLSGEDLDRALSRARRDAQRDGKSGCFPYLGFAREFQGPLDTQANYQVAMTSYISDGKDGYLEFATPTLRRVNSGLRLREICETGLRDLASAASLAPAGVV